MTKKMTPFEFIQKCEWEGGDILAGLEYGLDHTDLNDDDPKFKLIIEEMSSLFKKICSLQELAFDLQPRMDDRSEEENYV